MIDLSSQNQVSLHTNETCIFKKSGEPNQSFNGTWSNCNNECDCSKSECGILDNNHESFGIPFNDVNGGYTVLQWLNEDNNNQYPGIYVWFWPRNSKNIPNSLLSNNPDPTEFGLPHGSFPFGNWCPSSHFYDNVMVINTDFCGWAGNEFNEYSECKNTGLNCVDYVSQNPNDFIDAYWLINSIKIYQLQ